VTPPATSETRATNKSERVIVSDAELNGEIEAGAIVSGYAYAPEQYVVIDQAELEPLRASSGASFDAGMLPRSAAARPGLVLRPHDPAAMAGRLVRDHPAIGGRGRVCRSTST
jgi:hypothetical protein